MSDSENEKNFQFEISLSVLNHLGRNLYRNFITVLGEAISNAWDADAKNVWIDIDRESSVFSIKDDGVGMDGDEFQSKFLKIGYSKRASGKMHSIRERPYIGAKGIGKLALLSCAKRVSVFTKKARGEYVGGVIDNTGLDEAIKSDLTPDKYPLETLNTTLIDALSKRHNQGTIIVFEDTKEQIRNSIAHIKKLLALSFQFSIIDKEFTIHVNGEAVSISDLKDLSTKTQFAWIINQHSDIFSQSFTNLKKDKVPLTTSLDIKGFIGSVEKPRDLKISGTDERATIDLFVNGRLREKNILRHMPTQRIVESYIYGQIHFDAMDTGGRDPFTSSREGVIEDDPNFQSLIDYLKREALPKVITEWDKLRLELGKEGDDENPRKTKKARKARDLYSAARDEYKLADGTQQKDKVDDWLDALRDDAEFNLESYIDCFLSENLVRKYISEGSYTLKKGVQQEADDWKKRESDRKGKANLSYDVRQSSEDIDYLGMDALAITVEGKKDSGGRQSLVTDAVLYAPGRNVVCHTGLLTQNAKSQLRLTHENIKARVRKLMNDGPPDKL